MSKKPQIRGILRRTSEDSIPAAAQSGDQAPSPALSPGKRGQRAPKPAHQRRRRSKKAILRSAFSKAYAVRQRVLGRKLKRPEVRRLKSAVSKQCFPERHRSQPTPVGLPAVELLYTRVAYLVQTVEYARSLAVMRRCPNATPYSDASRQTIVTECTDQLLACTVCYSNRVLEHQDYIRRHLRDDVWNTERLFMFEENYERTFVRGGQCSYI